MRSIRVRSLPLHRASRFASSQGPQGAAKPIVDFSDTATAFQAKSLPEMLRGVLVFTMCRIKPLVERAEPLMRTSYKVLGPSLTNAALKATFFGHFCAGEDEEAIKPVIRRLESYGVGSILDYAAESDLQEDSTPSAVPAATTEGKATGRVYDYQNEALCDAHMATFEKAIRSVRNVSPTGFAAIKVTALGNPELLRRVSVTLTELGNLFHRLDPQGTGKVSREAFLSVFRPSVLDTFDRIDSDRDGSVDYIEWTNGLRVEELHLLTAHCSSAGPLTASVLDEQELLLLRRMNERIGSLAALAQELGVRLMIDAEHSYFQPAIDAVTVDLARRFNGLGPGQRPVIFSTYQLYLRGSLQRLRTDMDRARSGGYGFAAKLVRGAYMVIERAHATAHGLPDPIHASIADTHANYNAAIAETMQRIADGQAVEVMMATHNEDSASYAVRCMQTHGLAPRSAPVYFGQLLGMADHLTFCLAAAGYKSYKYVPYGRVHEVMPYLIRRAQENSDALSGAQLALRMTQQELRRRAGL